MQPSTSMRHLKRPHGLAARAALFAAMLIAVTAALTAAILIVGAQQASGRDQIVRIENHAKQFAGAVNEALANGTIAEIDALAQVALRSPSVRGISVRTADNTTVFEALATSADAAALDRAARRVIAEGQLVRLSVDGGMVVGAPTQDGGVALRSWSDEAFRFDLLPALAPILLLLAGLGLTAIPLTVWLVRRSLAPLDELTRFAETVTDEGATQPIELQAGDEFRTLANAFNQMIARLDKSMRHIQQIALVDPVTQLPNGEQFVREVDHWIVQGKAGAGAVLVFELQRLPKLMQMLDQAATRDFMRVIAERFTSAAQTVDKLVRVGRRDGAAAMAARLGTVEFAVFAPGVVSASDAARFAQHLNAALNQPFDWRGHKLTLGACCGVALAPRDGRDADAVIRHAHMALGAAQAAPGRLKVFTQSLDREAVAKLTLEREMRGALENNEFRAYFQPKINLANGRIEACEALARWVRPDRTIISPGRFIPVAEESGLIGALSDAIMREACWKAAAWARAGCAAKVSVNVSALQFRSERFAENVLRIVQHAGLAPKQLELEITESVVMEDLDRALRLIQPLREAGVRLAIDDFGCGHSSLAALSKLPFDVIKVDQQFVRALERGDAQGAAIIEMILALADTLGLEVVAEGVERRQEVEFMAARGCHWAQGFLYGAAVSAPEFAEMLRRQAGEDVVAIDAA